MLESPAVVKTLLNTGANIEVRSKRGETSLHGAAKFGSPAVVKTLLNAGANIEARDEAGSTLLLCLEPKEHCFSERFGGQTPLHKAVMRESPAVVKTLLNAGANIEARDKGAQTPLHEAVSGVSPDVVKALLDAGANPKAKASDGSTPWDLIQKNDALKGTDVYWLLHQARYD